MNSPAATRLAVRAERAPPPPPATVASSAGSFELTSLIHAGPWSRIYRARPLGGSTQDELYAVKVLAPDAVHAPLARRMLLREALLGREIAHPHVVSVLASQTQDEPPWLAMPYLAGATLRVVLKEGSSLPLARGLWLVRQIAQGLESLHCRGWRHGDLKPENVHVAADGHATLLDLGMVQRFDEPRNVFDRPFAGTLRYTAPECFVSRSRADGRSDFYSLGIVLYELLAGRVPFSADDPARLATAHLEVPPPELRRLRPDLPTGVCKLANRLLAKDPLRRPSTAEELVDALCRLEIAALGEELGSK